MSIGCPCSVRTGCATGVDKAGHKAEACKAVTHSTGLEGSTPNVRVDCATRVGRSWAGHGSWLKTC
ncbi:hypothetical protein Pyn_30344 [Prunus yedoensis var. nudiflora]|uniref:Uncharacterized protein n=1 Tax=Prunus yedoensis var. nudiflora TaxID=2094558 RepID=A0A314XJ70_PRUYE|nr:hypothetical protein Pyn_30344 [Prunus yedoensis var. nudiflora]